MVSSRSWEDQAETIIPSSVLSVLTALDAIVVGFLDLLEVGTASSILDGILLDDTGEVEDLLVVLLGELVDSGVETADLLSALQLGIDLGVQVGLVSLVARDNTGQQAGSHES